MEGDFGIRKAQLLTYNVADNLTFAPDAQPMVAYSADGALQASYGCMAEFTAKGDLVYTTSTPERRYGAWLLAGAAPTALVESGCAGLRLLPDGKLLLGQSKSSTIGLYNPEANTVVPLALTGDAAVGDYTGYLTNNYWYVNPEGRPDRTDSYTAGLRSYELKDHLGNVRVVVNDAHNVTAAYQYYAFGSPMPGRYGLANLVGQGGYRYGFNGKEKDDDLTKTTGATYDYGFRVYDARIAKFLSVDPLTNDYPWYTPFQFAGNSPLYNLDLDGQEEMPYLMHYPTNTNSALQNYGNAVINGVSSLYNIIPATWNSGVTTVRSIAAGTYGQDLGNELKGIGQSIRNGISYAAKSVVSDPTAFAKQVGKEMVSPQSVEFAVSIVAGAKMMPVKVSSAVKVEQRVVVKGNKSVTFTANPSKSAAKGSTTTLAKYWPENGGALDKWEREFLMPGTEIDRFGSGFGKYFSPRNTPMDMRALPGGNTGAMHL